MDRDEQAIRSVIATWMEASAAGDLARVLALMDDDVVFLGPGRPPMRGKDGFAAANKAMESWVIYRDANMITPAPQDVNRT